MYARWYPVGGAIHATHSPSGHRMHLFHLPVGAMIHTIRYLMGSAKHTTQGAVLMSSGTRWLPLIVFGCYSSNFFSVHRVHWLRARATQQRWSEEFEIVKKEMQWTTLFYMYMAKTWKTRRDIWDVPPESDTVITHGHRAYAERQIAMWNEFGRMSEAKFRACIPKYAHVWECVV